MDKEIWKDIPDYEGLYKISNKGKIKSIDRYVNKVSKGKETTCFHKGVDIALIKLTNGYLAMSLSKNGKVKRSLIHRLVAIAFIPNPENKFEVNHINGIKTDNRVENLEWATRFDNMRHAYNNKLMSDMKGGNHNRAKKVIDTRTKKIYGYVGDVSKIFNLNKGSLANKLSGFRKNNTPFMLLEDYKEIETLNRIKEFTNDNFNSA